ncbi:MAG TPA: glycosyl hydrolase [Acidobacteriaceae bacterium]|nr:glycosyl hydrolase [Acidobacteriaceae bacterium]
MAALAACLLGAAPAHAQLSPADALHASFLHPPDDARILMRWWWFGPAATKPEITRELEAMKVAGIGGVEIANLYPLALDDPKNGFRNTPYLSPEHLDALRFASQEARRLGLRIDITLCSGWPFGGPHIPVTEAAGKLRVETIAIPAHSTFALMPPIDAGEAFLSAYLLSDNVPSSEPAPESITPADGRFTFPTAEQPRTLITFLSSRTGMQVKRPSVGADGFVLDHYDKAAIETHLKAVGEPLLSAFGDHPPYAIFSDSLEVFASDWTPNLLEEFQRRRGYDLKPHLLDLVRNQGPQSAAVRHDWGRTLTELANENFLEPMQQWAHAHHTQLRSQSYGFPPVNLASNQYADLIEGEGKATYQMWREFSATRWAASAGHLYHHNVISSETWTWLHSPAFRATPLDMKAEADLHFLQGINQLVGHGWPYSPPSTPEPGWRMYAAAALDDHNPWFFAMPDLALYLQRVSYLLRQGKPVQDVAILLPDDDAWASFTARLEKHKTTLSTAGFDESGSNVSIDESMDELLGKDVVAQVLDAGFNPDFIDADAIQDLSKGGQPGIPYRALILPNIDRLPAPVYEKILAFARSGGIVLATGRTPVTAPGYLHAAEESARLKELSQQLFHGNIATARALPDASTLGKTLASMTTPDMELTPAKPAIGFLHRKLPQGDLYFVANTSNTEKTVQARFRASAAHAELWNPATGEISGIADATKIDLPLEPYGSRILYFSTSAAKLPVPPSRIETRIADLSHDWRLHFSSEEAGQTIGQLTSWTLDPKRQFFSGHATYEKSFSLPPANHTGEGRILLDFGPGQPLPVDPPDAPHNMRAYLESPIREAAEVFVNDQPAGVLWRPPYRVDITGVVREGENHLRIVVGNTAINALAGHPQPDYRLLWNRYGVLFVPQDMQDLQPLPSGLLGPVTLLQSNPVQVAPHE